MLGQGLSVLDVGCGTGAITAGIADAVGPEGCVIGVDRDEVLLELARKEHANRRNLRFEHGEATTLLFDAQFDIVTASRTLQWIAEPALAIEKMKRAAKRGGMLVVLDYNHLGNKWEPDPPHAFNQIYKAFLAWREANQWDNEAAAHLPELFRSAGLVNVASLVQDEVVKRGDPDFAERSFLWVGTMEHVGGQLIAGKFCTAAELEEGRDIYRSWAETDLLKQTLAMKAVIGVVP